MYVLEMLVRGIRSLKDAFPESRLAWLPERLQREVKARAQTAGTQGTQVGPGTCSRTQLACTLFQTHRCPGVFGVTTLGPVQAKRACPRLELHSHMLERLVAI